MSNPVRVLTDADLVENGGKYKVLGGPAIPVRGYLTAAELGELKAKGGPPINVYIVEDGDRPIVGGEATPVFSVVDLRGADEAGQGNIAYPIYVVNSDVWPGGSGPTPPFDPTQITGLQLWLSAGVGMFSDAAGITPAVDNDLVERWEDQSGNNNHAIKAVGATGPRYEENEFGLLPGADFTVSNSAALQLTSTINLTEFTFLLVARKETSTQGGTIIADGLRAANPAFFGNSDSAFRISSDAVFSTVVTLKNIQDNTTLTTIAFDGTTLTTFANSVQEATTAIFSGDGFSFSVIGNELADGSGYAANYVFGDLLLYDNKISDADLQTLRLYLNEKYGGYLLVWVFVDEFNDIDTAPMTTPRKPLIGNFSVITDTTNLMHTDGSTIIMDNRVADNDPRLVTGTYAREAGLTLIARANLNSTIDRPIMGWSTTTHRGRDTDIYFLGGADSFRLVEYHNNDFFNRLVHTIASYPESYTVAFVMRETSGYLCFIKSVSDAAFANWRLFWVTTDLADLATLYAHVGNGVANTSSADYLRIARPIPDSAPTLTDGKYEICTHRTAGVVPAATAFTHDKDGFIRFTVTTLPAATYIELRFRIQDANNYWKLEVYADGSMRLVETVGGSDTDQATAGAGTVVNGDTLTLRYYDEEAAVTINNAVDRNNNDYLLYSSMSNFKTATSGLVQSLGTGGVVSNLEVYPQTTLPTDVTDYLDSLAITNVSSDPSYAQLLENTYSANEVWPLVDIFAGTTIPAFINSNRNGVLSGWALQNTLGPVYGTRAPLSDGTSDYGNILTSGGSVGLVDIFNGSVGSVFGWVKATNVGVWSDGANRVILHLYADTNNYIQILKPFSPNDRFRATYAAGGTVKSVTAALSDTAWFSFGVSWDINAVPAGELKLYVNGSQILPTATTLGTWAGSLTDALIGAASTTPTNVWSGWIGYFAFKFGSVWSDTDFSNMHSAATTAKPD